MSIYHILLIVLIIVLFGGFRDWGPGPFYGAGPYFGGGGIGLLLLVVVLVLVFR